MNKQQIEDIKHQEVRRIRKGLMSYVLPPVFSTMQHKMSLIPSYFGYVSKKKMYKTFEDFKNKLEKDIIAYVR